MDDSEGMVQSHLLECVEYKSGAALRQRGKFDAGAYNDGSMEWPGPFITVENSQQRHALEAELQRELGPSHSLFGIPIAAIGRRFDQDDVIFELLDGTGRVGEVHLTWSGSREPLPWPETTLFDSFDEWLNSRSSAGS